VAGHAGVAGNARAQRFTAICGGRLPTADIDQQRVRRCWNKVAGGVALYKMRRPPQRASTLACET